MNLKKSYIYFINLAMIILIMVGDALYLASGTLLCKGLTSAMFVILGIINLIYAFTSKNVNKKFSIIILIGLLFAMLGDILLEVDFMIGAIFFGVGHIFFFVSYMFIVPFKKTDLVYGLAIIIPAVLLITLAPIFNFKPVMEVLCVVYAIVISFMLGKAMANLVTQKTAINIVIFLGSFLFFFSDLMLLFNVFGNGGKAFSYLCLLTYYPAEILLAISILVSSIFYNKENASALQQKQVRAETEAIGKEESNVIVSEEEPLKNSLEDNKNEKLEEDKNKPTKTTKKSTTDKTTTNKTTANKSVATKTKKATK